MFDNNLRSRAPSVNDATEINTIPNSCSKSKLLEYLNHTTMTATNWDKFRLLMWKNWLLQYRHKIQMIVEILVPVLFNALLVIIRSQVKPDIIPDSTFYNAVTIDSLSPLRIINANSTSPLEIDYRLLYTPPSKFLDDLLTGVVNALDMDGFVPVNSAAEMEAILIHHPYLAGLQFAADEDYASGLPKRLRYSLRFPGELRTIRHNPLLFNWQTDRSEPRFQEPGPRTSSDADGGIPPGYRREGFLAIQNAVARQFVRMQSNNEIGMPEVVIQRYPYPPYKYDLLLVGLESIVSLIIVLSFVYPCINTVKFIAAEKEKQLKEAMKIMGLSNWLHWTGWFLRSIAYMTISISLIVILLKVPWYAGSDVSVFTNTDWTILWFFLFVYSIATVMFCFMLSVFFRTANTAAAVSGIMWFIFYSVYTFTQQSYDRMALFEKLLMCLLSNTGMAFGFQIILRFEGTGEGMQWINFWKPVTVDDDLSLGYVILMLLATSALYLIITLYVEQILPGQYGVPRRWYFPFTRSFWCGPNLDYVSGLDKDPKYQDSSSYEGNTHGLKAGIRLQGLGKIYANKKVAVDCLTLDMYDDQITVLLGHNGAGKTTTMSMLTGMLTPSYGTALINGMDIRTNIDSVRSSLGLCPQHNILFDELTVREHIVFYSRLKGLDKDAVEAEVRKYVRLIDLEPKINAMSSTLSGGMKRKLSVCVAFCGGSKVVLCDEPTSGMDPAARRALWDVLQAEKKGRTVLLSTHFMDEADVLGDRIAIMGNGELKCCGSSYFLKKKFGIGYHLICVKGSNTNSEKITALLQKYVPDAVIENDIGSELSYQLPDAKSDLFQAMFKELEDNMEALNVISYGVSLTTLEEVFMRVGTDSVLEKDVRSTIKEEKSLQDFGSELTLNYTEDVYLLTGISLIKSQAIALFKKRILQTMRSWILLLVQIIIPTGFVILTVLSERTRTRFENLPSLALNLDIFLETISVVQVNPEAVVGGLESRFNQEYQEVVTSSAPLAGAKVITENIESFILNLSKTMLVWVNRRYVCGASMSETGRVTAWFNNQPYHSVSVSVGLVHNALIRAQLGPEYHIDVFNAPLPYTTNTRMELVQLAGNMGFQLAINLGFAMAFVAAFYVLTYILERQTRAKLLQFVSGAKVLTFWATSWIWDFITYFLTVSVLAVVFAILQEDGWSSGVEISRLLVIFVSFGYAMLPLTYILSMFFTIPASGFTRMTMFYVFTGVALFFIVYVFSLEFYHLDHIADALKWIFLIFPHFALSHSLSSVNVITQTEQMCRIRCELDANCSEELMCKLVPACCDNNYFSWSEPGIGRDLTYLYAMGTLAIIVLLLSEYRILSSWLYKIRSRFASDFVPMLDSVTDQDVLEERHRVANMSSYETEMLSLVVKDMSKEYGKFRAVNQISVAVDLSECFGLLGINGAGKTSTFKMFTGDEQISSGEAWVRGLSLKANMNGVRHIIGYCPQFDALIEELTGRETLELFCRLRGVPQRNIHNTSISLATDLNFLKHIDKPVRQYSGGNKRKLSTAVALIGNPVVVYLDEPTTGMDPGAKRMLWNMISKIRKSGKSIILTSHSMDECEAMCTRLAIMVNGEFKCLGSVQHLKNKFSKGFTLTVKTKKRSASRNIKEMAEEMAAEEVHLSKIKDYVIDKFLGSVLQEEYQGLLTFYILNTSLKWSTMFGMMEVAKRRFNIEDYSLSQTSLEQVFLAFAKQQHEEQNR